MRSSFLFFFVLSFIAASAQQQEIDSLQKQLKLHPAEDSTRFHIVNNIAHSYYQLNPAEGLKFADEAIDLAKKLRDTLFLQEAYYCKGLNYYGKSDYSDALELYKKAEAVLGNRTAYSRLFALHNGMAVVNMELSNYPEALKLYLDNLALSEKKNGKLGIATSCGNLAIIYRRLGDTKKALSYLFRSIDLYRELGRDKSIADAYGSLANTYDQDNMEDSALFYYKKEAEVSEKNDYTKGTVQALANLGIMYLKLCDYSKALPYFTKSIQIYTSMGDKSNIALMYAGLAELIYKAPDSVLKKIDISAANKTSTAIDYFKKSMKLAEEAKDIAIVGDDLEALSIIYKKQKKYDEALSAYEKFIVIKDSIMDDDKKSLITKIGLQAEFSKKEDSLQDEHEKKEIISRAETVKEATVKRAILAGGLILLSAGIAGFIFYKRNRDIRQQHKDAELKNEITETNMKVMRLQMNPHFIFNSLNSIGDYIIKNKPGEADAYLSKFAKVMRMTLENSEKKEIILAEDLLMLELYMQLEAKRLNDKFSYKINIGPGVDTENILVPPMIFQPFVENSIWHGIAKKEGKGHIDISISGVNGMLHCVIEDDGIGRQQSSAIQPNEQAKNASLGMKITKARIEILNRLKGSNATVQLIDKPQGLRAELQLPSESKF